MKTLSPAKALFFLFVPAVLFADVPAEITYQGRLREYGQPVNGTRTMCFRIFDAPAAGNQAWSSADVPIAVSSGVFSCILTPSGVDWRKKDYYLETVVSGKILSPREKITSQVYALHACTAEDVEKSAGTVHFSVGASTLAVILANGNAGIGTANPSAKLEVAGEVKSLSNGTTYYMVPRGAIVMWSGPLADIPPGWALCDGNNGTPDLRDRFIVSAGGGYAVGATGGQNQVALGINEIPSHAHSVSIANDGSHKHTLYGTWQTTGGGWITFMGTTASPQSLEVIDNGGTHSHACTIGNNGGGLQHENRPPYFALAFIMKL